MPRGSMAGKPRRPPRSPRPAWDSRSFTVAEPAVVARVLNDALRRRNAGLDASARGVTTWAAKRSGVPYTTLYRLVHGASEQASWQTARRLQDWLTPAEWRRMEKALVPSAVLSARRAYLDRLRRECRRLARGRTARDDLPLHEEFLPKEVLEVVRKFEQRVRKLRLPYLVAERAKLRVFDPIVGLRIVAGELRHVFTDEELVGFVRRGYKQEHLILDIELRSGSAAALGGLAEDGED